MRRRRRGSPAARAASSIPATSAIATSSAAATPPANRRGSATRRRMARSERHDRAPTIARDAARIGRGAALVRPSGLISRHVRVVVAPVALGAELPAVDVIGAVAGDAGRRQRRDLLARRLVAGRRTRLARCAPSSANWVRLVVIEVPDLPVAGVVAGRAVDAERALVLVVLRVARDALALRVLVRGRRVAGLALDARVAPEQREARLVVVEAHRLLPVDGVVALLALPAELLAVLVVLPVAGVAVGRRACRGRRAPCGSCRTSACACLPVSAYFVSRSWRKTMSRHVVSVWQVAHLSPYRSLCVSSLRWQAMQVCAVPL